MTAPVLSQTAPWNPALVNGYRTRYTEVGGRFFKVSAEFLYTPWYVEEITRDGEWMPDGFSVIVFTLAEAREKIAGAVQ